jgi:hypothetical protein
MLGEGSRGDGEGGSSRDDGGGSSGVAMVMAAVARREPSLVRHPVSLSRLWPADRRYWLAIFLGKCGEAGITPLLDLTADADPLVRWHATQGLHRIGGAALPPLHAFLLAQPDEHGAARAARLRIRRTLEEQAQ